jgi:3-hydroxyacyl-[acyl-carrier-protein] dehydratase
MTSELISYPFSLNRQAIEKLLPHRGDIFVCQHLDVLGPHDFTGLANWPLENALIQGHFPGLPVVPGVMLIESMAQLAGAGLLGGDPYTRSLKGNYLGVLATIRKCVFSRPVLPNTDVKFSIHCRQMGPMAVLVAAKVSVNDREVAQLEALMVYTDKSQMLSALAASA